MRIEDIKVLRGPNVHSYSPMLVMKLDLGRWADTPSNSIYGFNERLVSLLPGLIDHHCSEGRHGGFLKRLHEGTYPGHVIEHVALELSVQAEIPVTHGKTRCEEPPMVCNVIVEYKEEETMSFLLRSSVSLVENLLEGKSFDLPEVLSKAFRIYERSALGPSTQCVIEAAERRGIPWTRLSQESLIQFGYGKNMRRVAASTTPHTSLIAADIASDKQLTKNILSQAGIPVPHGKLVHSSKEALEAFQDLNPPFVVKPLDGRQGRGVSMNISTPQDLSEAFGIAGALCKSVLVEEAFIGKSYRVLVIDGRMIAASEKHPPQITGDGVHTINQLIEKENLNPLRGNEHDKPLSKITVDAITVACLRKNGLTLESVPEKGRVVILRESANLSTGGTAKDVTGMVHPDMAYLCERAAKTLGLDVSGVDLVTPDISEPFHGPARGIIEINAAPGLRMHAFPNQGSPQPVGEAILNLIYPKGAPARIPIISITGTNGKTTIARMAAHVLAHDNLTVGLTSTEGIYIGGRLIKPGDNTGSWSARCVLSDPSVDVAVLETARGGIVRGGLGYDWSDAAVISNITGDHIGQDGIENLEDLVHIKSLVAERVREGGDLILNAQDPAARRLAGNGRVRKIPKRIVYFSLDYEDPTFRAHLAAGGRGFFLQDRKIMEAIGYRIKHLIHVRDLPAAFSGAAQFNVANIMAAIASLRSCGITGDRAGAALRSFDPAFHNPGRVNFYRLKKGYVLLDYGHNAHAFESVSSMAIHHTKKLTGVVGVPGDRADWIIDESGRAAARGFHKVIIKEDKDRRGRERGEVAERLRRAVEEYSPESECSVILDCSEALLYAIETMEEQEWIVVFYDKMEPLLDILKSYKAVRLPETPAVSISSSMS